MKTYVFFVKIFGKPISKWVALLWLRCLPAWKRHKVSLNLGELWWFCLLFSANKRIAVGILFYQWLPFICLLLHELEPFSRNLWRTQLVRSCWSVSIRTNISLYTCLQSNFSIVYFLRKHVLGLFFHVFLFSFFFLWAMKLMRSWTNVDAFSDIQVWAFQKDAIEF